MKIVKIFIAVKGAQIFDLCIGFPNQRILTRFVGAGLFRIKKKVGQSL